MSKQKLALIIIFVLAVFLRFYKLGQVPASLYWDEVSLGYNAYSILETGKDEYGTSFPLRFKAFGEYKLPGYIYSTIPSIALFGLNEFAVRFPSALFGALTVLVTYFLTKELFRETAISYQLSAISSFLLAFSPWHLQLSRAAFETNVALFFFCLGFLLLLRKSFILASLFLSASLYFYYSFWLIVPFLMGFLLFFFNKKKIILVIAIVFVLSLPLINSTFLQGKQARFKQVGVLDEPVVLEEALKRTARDQTLWGRIFYHRFLVWGKTILKNYSQHFSPEFFSFKGDRTSRHTPYKTGFLFPVLLPFMVLGCFHLLKNGILPAPPFGGAVRLSSVATSSPRWPSGGIRRQEKKASLILFLFFIAPLAASFSWPSPHALRSELMLIPLQIMTAYGLISFFKQNFFKHLKVLGFAILISIFGFSFFSYWDNYYTHGYLNEAFDWGYGYRQLVDYIKEEQGQFDKVYITGDRWQPYIYFLFYLKYDPAKYQQEGSDHGHFAKYYFGQTDWDGAGKTFYKTKPDKKDFLKGENNLIILSGHERLKPLPFREIRSPTGGDIFLIYRTLDLQNLES